MERPSTIRFPKSELRSSRNGHSGKGKADTRSADDADARYAAALKLIQAIDGNLRKGTRHYYDSQGNLLNSLDEVVHALLTDTLAADKPSGQAQQDEAVEWMPASQLVA